MKKLGILLILTSLAASLQAGHIVIRPRVAVGVPVVYPSTHVVVRTNPWLGRIDVNCNRDDARLYLNGKYVGSAGSFDGFPGKLVLKPGTYRIKLVYRGQVRYEKVQVLAGRELNLRVRF